MRKNVTIVLNLDWRALSVASLAILGLLAAVAFSGTTLAQKSQESFKDKLDIADAMGGVAIATSADGKQVYVADPGDAKSAGAVSVICSLPPLPCPSPMASSLGRALHPNPGRN